MTTRSPRVASEAGSLAHFVGRRAWRCRGPRGIALAQRARHGPTNRSRTEARGRGHMQAGGESGVGMTTSRREERELLFARSPYLTTSEAAEYLRYRSSSSIRTLKMKGLLRPAGRRGS